MSSSVPVIDISPLLSLADNSDGGISQHPQSVNSVVEQISNACKSYGFFAVTHHGVDPSIIDHAWNASKEFFDLDPAIKSSVPMSTYYPYGYENHESLGIKRETLASSVEEGTPSLSPDSKETFSIGPIDSIKSGMPPREFPSGAPSSFAPSLAKYFDSMEKLARVLFKGLALALQLDDPSWFIREGFFDEGHQCALRMLNYPRLEYKEDLQRVRIRAGAHTDYGAFTILKSGGPGLQLKLSSDRSSGDKNDRDPSSWIDVPHLSGAFIINLGDLMQRWTNDRWRSTLHRVVAVGDGGNDPNDSKKIVFQSARRQSIAFFVNVNGNAIIVPFDSCVDDEHPSRYDAIKASRYLIQRHSQSMGDLA